MVSAPSAWAIFAMPPLCDRSGEGASRGINMSSTTTARSCEKEQTRMCVVSMDAYVQVHALVHVVCAKVPAEG